MARDVPPALAPGPHGWHFSRVVCAAPAPQAPEELRKMRGPGASAREKERGMGGRSWNLLACLAERRCRIRLSPSMEFLALYCTRIAAPAQASGELGELRGREGGAGRAPEIQRVEKTHGARPGRKRRAYSAGPAVPLAASGELRKLGTIISSSVVAVPTRDERTPPKPPAWIGISPACLATDRRQRIDDMAADFRECLTSARRGPVRMYGTTQGLPPDEDANHAVAAAFHAAPSPWQALQPAPSDSPASAPRLRA